MLRIALAFVISAIVPLTFKYILHSEISIYLILGLVWLKTAAGLIFYRSSGRVKEIFRILSPVITLLFAALILIGLLITPFSAYKIWFESVKDNTQRGVVSNLFVLLFAFFSSTLSFFTTDIILPITILTMIVSGLLSLVYQTNPFYIALTVSLAAFILYLALRYTCRGKRVRSIGTYLLFSLIIACASFFLSLLGEARGSRIIDLRIHPDLRKAVVTLFPRFPILYGVPGFGFSFNEKRLGGTPVLSGSPIFEVKGEHTGALYLRTRVFEYYNGKSWSVWKDRSSSNISDSGELFSTGHPDLSKEALSIKLLMEYYPLLPHTLDTRSIVLGSTIEEAPEGDLDSAFIFSTPMRFGDTLVLKRDPLKTQPVLEEPGIYLQIPEGFPQKIMELAEILGSGYEEPEGLLRAIGMFLATNFTYNLKDRGAGLTEDFVEHFLFKQKEGYCVHFATAFIMLARLNGIPARYTVGFLHYRSERDDSTTITGLSAHAWPEVWLKGKGWTTWEATTAVNPAYYDELGEQWLYEYGLRENTKTTRQLAAILGRKPVRRESAFESGKKGFYLYPFLILLILVPPFVFLGRYIVMISPALKRDRAAALKILKRIVLSSAFKDLSSPEKIGWIQWAGKAKDVMPQASAKVERMLILILHIIYSSAEIQKRDIRFLFGFFMKYCRKKLKIA